VLVTSLKFNVRVSSVADAMAGLLGLITKLRHVLEGDVLAGSYSESGREDDLKAERSRNVYCSHTIYVRAVPFATSNVHNDLHTVM
jgi:hypothetical protein